MKKKFNKGQGTAMLLVIALVLGGLAYYASIILSSTGIGEDKSIKLGLDLAGGVSITYQVEDDNPTAEQLSDTIYKLQKRVEGYSTEAVVYQEGGDRITVEIPGVTDANAILEELGKPGSLEFQTPDGETFMTGDMIVSAQAGSYKNNMGNNEFVVDLTFTDEGAAAFAEMTSANIGNRLPIVYDEQVISDPIVEAAITGGNAQITKISSYEEAERLASNIRIGSLSLQLSELRSNVVGAQLGSAAISTSLKAAAIGLVIVMLFMMIVYFVPGVAASIALAIYTCMVIATLYLFEVTLTLPGIAGIILSIGMAVDANVIIFARIREEIANGKTVASAMDTGFKKALSAIIDGNVTTLIAAAVLFMLGSGTVKGFASTLAIGIILSMFTALVITRVILNALYAVGLKDEKYFGTGKTFKVFNLIDRRILFFGISLVVIAAGLITMGVNASGGNALNYSLDFVGGTSTTMPFEESYTVEQIDEEMVPLVEGVTGDSNVQTTQVQGTNQIIFKTRTLSLAEREELNEVFIDKYGINQDEIQSESISSAVSSEMRQDAVKAVIIAVICMLIYIWFRFSDARFAVSAILALVHDVLVVLTCYAVLRISVGSTFIACMLTIIGYSINDTIVIFDRIRENIKAKNVKDAQTLKDISNQSLTQTLSRTINTSITTFVMVFVLWLLGVTSIRDFALPLMVGLISGSYSSVCVATQLWFEFKRKIGKNRVADMGVK
ncbi:MAG: protein translocase subunit SecD [Eubacterium sp.]|jgi:SecD/SecF fusion protein|nr:protein translocase subunit SecD [Eubacterium sp.]NBI86157.1 protein translocase subunit SecD [Lachnospiraceae bacterium]